MAAKKGVTAVAAALVNGAPIHSLEYDDTHTASVAHGSAFAASASLAAAEEAGAGGASLLAGYIAAWEVTVRLGLAAPGAYQANGFQISAVGGAVGSAVAAIVIGRLDEKTATAALGIAGSEASGLMAFLSDGSSVKALHPGWAAHAGLSAAALAEAGMTGPADVLEGRFGFLEAFTRDAEAPARLLAQLDDLGRVWHLPDAAFKLYPCCHYIHPFLDALDGAMREDGLTAETCSAVVCQVPEPMAPLICEPWKRRQAPDSGYDGKWGLAYCLAALLVHGAVTVETFIGDPDPAVVDVARRMTWEPLRLHTFPARFEARLIVERPDGSRQEYAADDVRGTPRNPVPDQEILRKLSANGGRALPRADVVRLSQMVLELEDAKTLEGLTATLRSSAKHSG